MGSVCAPERFPIYGIKMEKYVKIKQKYHEGVRNGTIETGI